MAAGRLSEGSPATLGATVDGSGVNFAVFSANATRMEVCLFDERGEREVDRITLPEYTDEIWHGRVEGLGPGAVYALRADGPYEPEAGHRFNRHKLLLDPYARQHVGALRWDPAVFGYTIGDDREDLSFDERDSAPFMPKCRVVGAPRQGDRPARPRIPWEQTIFYETHVRGFTQRHPHVPEKERGRFAGLAHRSVIDHIRDLGVTAVELLPIHSFLNDSHLLDQGLTNYWGYNTIGFFAPDPRYLGQDQSLDELAAMIDAFHAAGLEVILDVVYNHTAEGSERGATLSFRGLDNASYYRLLPDQPRYHVNDTGTGNTLNISHPRVLQMVMDSLRYWVERFGVDGFRFDLATILGREPTGFDYGSAFVKACRQDPVLSTVKLIAEPWDCGPGGYQVGGFPPGWAEWNDRFRDTVRAFWKGDEGVAADLATRLTGSTDKFGHGGRRPWASVNFVTAHDGFTLHDLVSYDEKHNEANGEDNRDGHSDNRSWNCGAEGPTDDAGIRTLRERQKRNLLATLLLSQGTPMLVAGDEFGRTQNGNNNAYCQDNEISWVDWEITDEGAALKAFVSALTRLRRTLPILHRGRFLSGVATDADLADIRWIGANGDALSADQWADGGMKCLGLLLDGKAPTSGLRIPAADSTVLVVVNAHHDVVDFTLPATDDDRRPWRNLIDTNLPTRDAISDFEPGAVYQVTGRSLLLFVQQADGETARVLETLESALTDNG